MTATEPSRAKRSDAEVDLLRALQRYGRQSRAELSRRLQVQRSTATKIVRHLLEAGTVREVEEAGDVSHRGAGRPGQGIELSPDHIHFLGAEVGVGYVRVLRMDLLGQVRATGSEKVSIADQSPEQTADICLRLLEDCAENAPRLGGLAIALPGIVRRDGTVVRVPKLGWRDIPFKEILRPHTNRFGPLSLENDANAFAMGELIRHGYGEREFALFVYIVSGVGGAIVDRGTFLTGQSGLAGEFGHVYVRRKGLDGSLPTERLEEIAGIDALFARYRFLGGTGESLEDLVSDLAIGAAPATRTIEEWISALAQALAGLTSILNPQRILIGGPLADLLEQVRDPLVDELRALTMHGTPTPQIDISHTAENAVILGCAEIQRLAYLQEGSPFNDRQKAKDWNKPPLRVDD